MISPLPLRPPYPRLGELYRIISGALDTKGNNRVVDRLAREGDYDWSIIRSLNGELIADPLKKYSDSHFADLLAQSVSELHKSYLELVTNFSLEGLTREETLPILIKHFFCPYGAKLLNRLKAELGGPDPLDLLDDKANPIEVVIDYYSRSSNLPLAKIAYPSSTGTDKQDRDMVNRWARTPQPPDLVSLKRFTDALEGKILPPNQSLPLSLRRWLIIARGITWLERESPTPLRAVMRQHFSQGSSTENIKQILFAAAQASHKAYEPLIPPGQNLYNELMRTSSKNSGDMAKLAKDIEDYHQLTQKYDVDGKLRFHLEWMQGRWHALAGLFQEALEHYQLAAQLSDYRAGAHQKDILEEALVLAAYLGKKPLLNQLKHRAVAFGIFTDPRCDDVIEDWEIQNLCEHFYSIFPQSGRFIEARASGEETTNLPFLVFSTEEIDRYKPDLKKPDRIISVHSLDGQKRRWPQLRLFASVGKEKEVISLLAHGAPVDQTDSSGGSALLCAIQHATISGDRRVLDLLLNQPHAKSTLDRETIRRKLTPLNCAIEYGEPDVVEKLLLMGASTDHRGGLANQTPLYYCNEKLGILKYPGKAIQHLYSSFLNNPDHLQKELRRRYNVSLAGVFGDKNDHLAFLEYPQIRQYFDQMVKAIVKEQTDRFSEAKLNRIVELLLAAGANPNAPHEYPADGRTPLMLAAENDSSAAFSLMMKSHGNPYQKDGQGMDCLRIATNFRSRNILNLLQKMKII